MKVIVSARANTLDSEVDPRFGRGAYFLLIDLETEAFDAIDNTSGLGATQGAGVMAAQTVASSGAAAVLTGHCGPKAFTLLRKAGIDVYTGVEGSVRDAITRFSAGDLASTKNPDVDSHW